MRTIAHLSDLHFGRSDAAVADALSVHVRSLKPDVVVISGDLTQRAREREYQQAADFLRLLPSPQIIVPGNHDVPLHNVVARLRSPLDFYRRYISDDLAPYYRDEEIAVLGINTARSLTWKNGRISREQVIASCEQLERSTEQTLAGLRAAALAPICAGRCLLRNERGSRSHRMVGLTELTDNRLRL